MAESKESIYSKLSKIDVRPYLKSISRQSKKTGQTVYLSYLSWAKAWGLVKAIYPDVTYKIREYPNYIETANGVEQAGTLDYRLTRVGCEVEVTVTIEGHDYTQKLYPMDNCNQPIMKPNIMQINKAQLRCLVKALAMAGLGLNVYAGEDLPSDESETAKLPKQTKTSQSQKYSTKELNDAKNIAKKFEVQYGGGKEKLVDICSWAETGDGQAQLFLKDWIKKDAKNLARYNFIMKNGLEAKQKDRVLEMTDKQKDAMQEHYINKIFIALANQDEKTF